MLEQYFDSLMRLLSDNTWIPVTLIGICFFGALYFLKKEFDNLIKKIKEFGDEVKFEKIAVSKNFLALHLKEITLNFQDYPKTLICKEDPVYYLTKKTQTMFKHSYWYRFGQNFTGIALILTFLLIGQAVYDIGLTLQGKSAIIDSSNNLKSNDKMAKGQISSLTESQSLGRAIEHLRTKFIISVLGIAFSIIYQLISHSMSAKLYAESKQKLVFLNTTNIRLHEYADLDYQRQQAEGALESAESIKSIDRGLANQLEKNNIDLTEIKVLLSNLSEIDVKVGDLATNVTQQLENIIDKSIGERLTLLLNAQKESTEKIASELGKVLAETMGKELEATFAKLAETLPSIISNGASGSSQKMAETFDKMADTLPALFESMNVAMIQMKNQQSDGEQSSKKVNEDLLKTISSSVENFNALSVSNTKFQEELLVKMTGIIDDLHTSSEKNTSKTKEVFTDGAKKLNEEMSNGAGHLVSSINQVKNIVTEIEKMSNALRINNSTSLSEVNNTLSAFKGVTENISKYNQEMGSSIQSLLGITKQLSEAPELTRHLISDTKKASDSITESYQNLEKTFVSGIGQIASVYASKIQLIEDQSKSIKVAYEGASAGLNKALDPLEELSENIEKLNKTIMNQSISVVG
jgi:hypothetical protein